MGGEGRDYTGATAIYADDNMEVTPYGGTVAGPGDFTIATPSAGKRLVVRYLMYNPSSDAVVYWHLGPGGTPLLKNDLTAKSVISRGFDYPGTKLRGAVGESLFLTVSNGSPVQYTALVTEDAE